MLNASESNISTMPPVDIFTFITVYYKHGEYGADKFQTLRKGLQEFLEDYINGSKHEDGILRQQLEALPDDELLTELLELGKCRSTL
jgi:hypothetical protein